MRRLAAVGVLAALATTPFLLPEEPAEPRPETPTTAQVVRWINRERGQRNLSKLTVAGALTRKATAWSSRLARTGLFVHASLTLRGTRFSYLAETLYRGPGGPVGPWLRSPPHRTILLKHRLSVLGIGRSGNVFVGRFAAK